MSEKKPTVSVEKKNLKKCDETALTLYGAGAFGWDEKQKERIEAAGYDAADVIKEAKKRLK